MTSGTLFLLGGGGLALFSLAGVAAFLILRGRGKKLKRQIHSEYSDTAAD